MIGTLLFTSLVLGLTSSLHCAMMCGPLATVACSRRDGGLSRIGTASYFGGRLVSYAFVGALFGTLGAHATHHLPVTSVQHATIIAVAAVALYKGVRLLVPEKISEPLVQLGKRRQPAVVRFIAPMLPKRGLSMGLVTGFLPCGMLALAWTTAAASGTPETGAAVMAVFAIGSIPGLAGSIAVGLGLGKLRHGWSSRRIGLMWCAFAIFVGLRPLIAAVGHGH